jgi:hypothetical protein
VLQSHQFAYIIQHIPSCLCSSVELKILVVELVMEELCQYGNGYVRSSSLFVEFV